MKERKPKIKEIKRKGEKKTLSSVLFMGLSLFLTVALFIGLVIAQSFLLEDITYKNIVVAKTDIPKDVIITEANLPTYFTTKPINILDTTAGAMEDATQLIGQKTAVMIHAGEPVAAKDFENLLKYISGLEEPVEISIKIPDIASADGGKLRAGDLINLTMMFTNEQLGNNIPTEKKEDNFLISPDIQSENGLLETNGTSTLPNEEDENNTDEDFKTTTSQYRYETWAQYVMENLYVYKALDASGIEIESTDTEALADILIFVIEKDAEADLNNALANCAAMRISKVYKKPDIAFIDISVVGENGEILSEDHIQSEVTPPPSETPSPTEAPITDVEEMSHISNEEKNTDMESLDTLEDNLDVENLSESDSNIEDSIE